MSKIITFKITVLLLGMCPKPTLFGKARILLNNRKKINRQSLPVFAINYT